MGDDEAAFCIASTRMGKFEAQRERVGLLFCDLGCSRVSVLPVGWTLPLDGFPALDLPVVMRILSLGGTRRLRIDNTRMFFGTAGVEVTHKPPLELGHSGAAGCAW